MVFSRYVTVLRQTTKVLQSMHPKTKVNTERLLSQASPNFYSSLAQENAQTDTSEKIASIIPKIIGFSSKSSVMIPTHDVLAQNEILEAEKSANLPGALETCKEDLSYIAPLHQPSFNFAHYANDSPMIRELAKLGVKFYLIEENPKAMEILLRYSFDDMKPYIQFLHDTGVPAENIGQFITRNPFIFTQDMDDLHTRIRYLRAHDFDREMIARIVDKNPHWLMFSTKRIDNRLGYFQREFQLTGTEVRALTTKQPRLITFNFAHLRERNFVIREVMGFNKEEVKTLILAQPGLLMIGKKRKFYFIYFVNYTA